MATVGFESVIFGVKTGVGGTLEELVADKSKGGAIEAKITGLGATSNTTYASNVPFFIASKGVSSPKVTLDVAEPVICSISRGKRSVGTIGRRHRFDNAIPKLIRR